MSTLNKADARGLIEGTFNEFTRFLERNAGLLRDRRTPFTLTSLLWDLGDWKDTGRADIRDYLFRDLSADGYNYLLRQCSELADIYQLSTRDRLRGASVENAVEERRQGRLAAARNNRRRRRAGNELDAITGAARRAPGNSEINAQQPTQEEPLEQFVTIVRSLVGVPYHMRYEATREGIDCSGIIFYALWDMGYNVTRRSAAEMESGMESWITIIRGDTIPEGTPGLLNFYDWGRPDGRIRHVNVGVGQRGNEPKRQIIDATEGDWMVTSRSLPRHGQVIQPGIGQVNQTFEPFSSNSRPVSQGRINFDVLERDFRPAR
ncbi:MAG: hypothetical protein FWC64_09350 [Treponema sp.]|nr:hypothetical protein [Treponema sp.]